jgi:hypothetical protein
MREVEHADIVQRLHESLLLLVPPARGKPELYQSRTGR